MNADFAKALVKAQAEMPGIEKDSRNPHFKSEFVSLDHLLAEALPVLNRNGIALVQMPTFNEHAQPTLTTTLVHESGDTLASSMPLFLPKQDPQGQGSAITYARRYAAAAALGISSEKDDDGNQAVKNAGETEGAAAPEPGIAGAAPAPSPAEPNLAERWNRLTLAEAKAKPAEINDADLLRRLLIVEGERRDGQRKTVLTAISKRIQELEGEPESGEKHASPAVADAARGGQQSVSQNGEVPPAESAEPLQELQACLAFIAEQPGAVDNASFWTQTNVLVGLSASGAGEFKSLAEVPAEWVVKVLEKVPTEVRRLVGTMGPESQAKLAEAVA